MKERLIEFLAYLGIGQNKFEEKVGLSIGYINKLKGDMKFKTLEKVTHSYPELNENWLKTGEGSMLNEEKSDVQFFESENRPSGKRLIPLWDDISTIGGRNKIANISTSSQPSEWIDPGDWFKSATHALRHYEDSMIEYPTGCILALKQVYDRRLLIPGKDYVFETSEYRITKKLGKSKMSNYVLLVSTNEAKRDDGTLLHEPFDVEDDLIIAYYEVLGYVVKRGGGTIVFSNQK